MGYFARLLLAVSLVGVFLAGIVVGATYAGSGDSPAAYLPYVAAQAAALATPSRRVKASPSPSPSSDTATPTATDTPTVSPTTTPSPTATSTPTFTPTPVAPSVGLILRAVVQFNGIPGSVQTPIYGGAGMTVTHVGSGQYRMDFPPGTWIDPTASRLCNFVPVVSELDGVITGIYLFAQVVNSDGSGTISVGNASSRWSIVAMSADC